MEIFNKIPSFKVARKSPEMIAPSKPTPRELKPLSDIDDKDGLRFQIVAIQFYQRNPLAQGKDPVKVIRDAIARALVFYYPLAGRLRQCAARKLVVECTGEGAVFVEADTNVSLWQLGGDDDVLYPPFPYLDKLLYNVPGTTEVLNCPLILIQVYI